MKPLISYYGGKVRMAPHILPHIEAIPHTVYCEPFCGGAALLFAKPRRSVTNNDHYREVINDRSDLLINMYRVAVEQREAFELKLKATLYSQSEYRRAIAICKNPDGYSDLEKAWAYYVNIQQSFSNKLNGGWAAQVLTRNSAATWDAKKYCLSETLDRIADVHISCEDAIACIRRWDSPQTLFYIDPPYPEANQGHYGGYTLDDWRQLCKTLDGIQGSYVLSNYPQPIEPESAQQRVEIDAHSSAAKVVGRDRTRKATAEEMGDRSRTEVLWICDRSSAARGELHGIMRHEQLSLVG